MKLVIVLAALLFAAGCSMFCPPAPRCASIGAVVVRVVDADTKAPLVDATVRATGSGAETEVPDCPYGVANPEGWDPDAGRSNCRAIQSPGKYHIVVRAPGYAETALDVDAWWDECGHLTSQVREVGLQKLGSAVQPMVNASEACGG